MAVTAAQAMIGQVELVEQVRAYDPRASEDLLSRAYDFSVAAHGSQIRESGDPYYVHPVEVAGILAEMRLDADTIATALLHDTVEDTLATLGQIEGQFGADIARLVDGVTKLSLIEMPHTEETRQAENFRKLVLAMSNDIRVLLVKLADRLHNMRTLKFVGSGDKRRRIALETMEIYAPLAERIGMHHMKDELEDLAFAELRPEARETVLSRLEFLREQGSDLVPRVTEQLRETLEAASIGASVTGREKRPYSIWRKMEQDNVGFEQLSDIMAFRIVVEDAEDCYRALGAVHARYPMVPGRFKDYISTPKRNDYRSLHTTVIGPEQNRVEIQIRTRDMHRIAEYGVAAHWQYKQHAGHVDGNQYRWLRELREILENASDSRELLEHTKLEMFSDQVFCFSPKGELIVLPRGATPVDFAYAVHTDVGDTCTGARINGKLAPLRSQLRNGDQVEILRSAEPSPSPIWENFVITGKARSAVRRFVRKQQRSQYRELGRAIMKKAVGETGRRPTGRAVRRALKSLGRKSLEELYIALGSGDVDKATVVKAIYPDPTVRERAGKILSRMRPRIGSARDRTDPVFIRGLTPGVAVHMAGCCHPLPGERIIGILTAGKGVTVHTIDCEALEQFNDTPERWLDVAWDANADPHRMHVGRIETVLSNTPGSLSRLTTVIADNSANISNLKITDRSSDFYEFLVDIEVKDVAHLTGILAALRAEPAINSVERVRG